MNDVRFSTPYIIIYNTSIKHKKNGLTTDDEITIL